MALLAVTRALEMPKHELKPIKSHHLFHQAVFLEGGIFSFWEPKSSGLMDGAIGIGTGILYGLLARCVMLESIRAEALSYRAYALPFRGQKTVHSARFHNE